MNQTKTNANGKQYPDSIFEELAGIVLDDDIEELKKDYWAFNDQSIELLKRFDYNQDNITAQPGYYQISKQVAWNDYAKACIEEKLHRMGTRV